MKRPTALAVVALLAGACSSVPATVTSTSESPPTTVQTSSSAPSPTTSEVGTTTTTTTTTTTVPPVVVRLGAAEALAASRGVRVLVEAEGVAIGELAGNEALETSLSAGAPLTLTYLAPDGTHTDVTWVQTVTAPEVTLRQPWRQEGAADGDIVLVWQSLGSSSDYVRQLDAAPGVTVVSPIWWYVRADGTISDQSDAGYVTSVHQRGVSIWPAVAGLDADANHALLGDPERRSVAVRTIAESARSLDADGVNIDIEGFREEDAEDFVRFVEELTALVHEWGGVVSYDLIPRSDQWDVSPPELAFWSTAPPRRAVAGIVDYTVLMAYDQHNRYRPAGPVAAPDWVLDTLVYLLRYADPHTVVLGIPFYGRIWDPADLEQPRARGITTIEAVAEDGQAELDPAFGIDRVTLADGRFLWLEDSALLAERLELVDAYGLAGWAAWRLGFDSPSLWEALAP